MRGGIGIGIGRGHHKGRPPASGPTVLYQHTYAGDEGYQYVEDIGLPPASGLTSVRMTAFDAREGSGTQTWATIVATDGWDNLLQFSGVFDGAGVVGKYKLILARADASGYDTSDPFDADLTGGATVEIAYDMHASPAVGRCYVGGLLAATVTDTASGPRNENYYPARVELNAAQSFGFWMTAVSVADGYQGTP